jgi:hypothetical protein
MSDCKQVLLIIAICAAPVSLNYITLPLHSTHSCIAHAAMMQLFEITSWEYNAALAFLVNSQIDCWDIFLESYPAFVRWLFAKRLCVCHIAIWGFAVVSGIFLAVNGDFGGSGPWCWIKPHPLCLYFGYVPLWIGYIITFVCNGINRRILRKTVTGSEYFERGMLLLIVVPVLNVLLHIPGTVRRCMELAGHEGKSYVILGDWQACCDPLEGVLR